MRQLRYLLLCVRAPSAPSCRQWQQARRGGNEYRKETHMCMTPLHRLLKWGGEGIRWRSAGWARGSRGWWPLKVVILHGFSRGGVGTRVPKRIIIISYKLLWIPINCPQWRHFDIFFFFFLFLRTFLCNLQWLYYSATVNFFLCIYYDNIYRYIMCRYLVYIQKSIMLLRSKSPVSRDVLCSYRVSVGVGVLRTSGPESVEVKIVHQIKTQFFRS